MIRNRHGSLGHKYAKTQARTNPQLRSGTEQFSNCRGPRQVRATASERRKRLCQRRQRPGSSKISVSPMPSILPREGLASSWPCLILRPQFLHALGEFPILTESNLRRLTTSGEAGINISRR